MMKTYQLESIAEANKLKKLESENAYPIYKAHIKHIANEKTKNDYNPDDWDGFLDCLDGRKLASIFVDIRDIFLNHDHLEVSEDEILFFERGLRKFGKLIEKAEDVTRKILKPCTQSDQLMEHVFIPNFSEFKQIVIDAGDVAEDLKENIRKLLSNKSKLEGIKKIANELDIYVDVEDEDTKTE